MEIFNRLNENKGLSLALGYFDGVHSGHQKVIKSAVDFAKENATKSAVITFKDHPCCYFYGVCPKYILQSRREKIEALGVDFMYELDFDKELCSLSADEYLKSVLIKYFEPKAISTGFNHNFGAKKSGNAGFLRENQKLGYKYFEIEPQKLDGEIISSTAIRKYLSEGNIERANDMLGGNFKIQGKVIKGEQLGRTIGFKTANLTYPNGLIDIPFGVYETKTQYGKAITNFGIKPTISDKNEPVLETHILNFEKDIYGTDLDIEFVRMLRKEQKFNSLDELKAQIAKDVKSVTK